MGHCRIFVVVVLTLLTTARLGEAQTVRLSVYRGGVETTPGWFYNTDDVRIDIASIHANYSRFEFIRIVDMASPQGDIARVSVYRSGTNAVPEAVKILIGAAEDDGLFPDRFNEDILHGCRHWGLPLAPGGADDAFVVENMVPEETKIILAAAISGDLTGKITTGQVFRPQVTGGVIADDVTATWPSAFASSDVDPNRTYTIERIEAKSITGRIIAGDVVGPPVNMAPIPCAIRDIVVGVGHDPISDGIRGDILAFGGHIRHIESTGHIGTAENPINIHSGFGLAELFCTATENGQPAPRDVHADIRTNLLAPTTGNTHDYDGFIRRVRISGSLYGAVEANIMRPEPITGPPGGYEGSDPLGSTNGLLVAGTVHAPITLRQGMLVTSMIADEFTQPIEMETYLKGRIIATNGGILALMVGTQPHTNTLPTASWGHGFIASEARPDWDPSARFPFPNCNQDPEEANEPAAVVRAATSIGYLSVSQMVKGSKLVPPMVETPRIDVLRIGSLEYGVVWSGNRTGCTPQPHGACPTPASLGSRCGPNPGDPASYASLGDAEIQNSVGWIFAGGQPTSVEYDAGLYVASFDRLDIMRRLMVHIHLLTLDAAEHIRVGCSFGSEGTNDSGRIYVHGKAELRGQITVNAHAATSTDANSPCPPWGPSSGDQSLGW
ncbi:MAG: hypothetical protein DYG92_13130 [Leptolyngbya sp. PLA1]|nr:hypothetical protein [Leptolyngbya sp. PLA1]